MMTMMNNSSLNKPNLILDEREYIFDRLYIRIIFITLYTIVFCFCVFGNLLVILVVTLHWKMRNITKFCLGNLAFADFCVGMFCVYQNLSAYLIQSWVIGEFLCKMYQFINALSHTASILILVVICVERYLAILHPFRCKQIMTINRLRIIIVAVWLVSAVYCSPRLYYFVTFEVPNMTGHNMEIICIAQRTRYDSKTFDMIHFFLLFLLPLLVLSVLYTRMGITLWRSSKNQIPWNPTPRRPSQKSPNPNSNQTPNPSPNLSSSLNFESLSENKEIIRIRNSNNSRVPSIIRLATLSQAKNQNHPGHNIAEYDKNVHGNQNRDQQVNNYDVGDGDGNGNDNGKEYEYKNQVENNDELPQSNPRANIANNIHGLHRNSFKNVYPIQTSNNKPTSYTVTVDNTSYIVRPNQNEIDIIDSSSSDPSRNQSSSSQSPTPTGNCNGSRKGKQRLNRKKRSASDSENQGKSKCKHSDGRVFSCRRNYSNSSPEKGSPPQAAKKSLGGEEALRSRQTVVKMLIVIVLTFAICNFPFHLRKMFQYWWPNYDYVSTFSTLATPLTQLIMYANCAVNPMTYAFMSKEFRSSFKDLLCCRWKKPIHSSGSRGSSTTRTISVKSAILLSRTESREC